MFCRSASKPTWMPTVSRIIWFLPSIILFFIPSFIQSRLSRARTTSRRSIGPTSYLDGLRGIAAIVVFFHHDTDFSAPFLNYGYGAHKFKTVLQLPFIRLWCSGQPMVHIFFVISGYVLSIKPVRLMRQGSWDQLADCLASSAFRRGFRLFLPSIAGLAFFELTITMGLQFVPHAFLARAQVMLYSWNWNTPHRGLLHLWTIPVEFSSSLFLFLCIIALSRLKRSIRIGAEVAIIAHCLYTGHWAPAEFVSGLFIAEIEEHRAAAASAKANPEPCTRIICPGGDHASSASSCSSCSTVVNGSSLDGSGSGGDKEAQLLAPRRDWSNSQATLHEMLWFTLLIAALYVAGWSKYERDKEPVLSSLLLPLIPAAYHTPQNHDTLLAFPFAFAAFFIVWSLFRLGSIAQAPFNAAPVQYLGDISFAFYIVHDFLLVGWPRYRIAMLTSRVTGGRGTPTKATVSVLLELAVLMLIIVCIADVFWRLVDRPSVRFARWLEAKCRADDGQRHVANAAPTISKLLS